MVRIDAIPSTSLDTIRVRPVEQLRLFFVTARHAASPAPDRLYCGFASLVKFS